jgi:hypothetical protein
MSHAPRPAPPNPPAPAPAPAVQITARCPRCGREPAIVFPLVRATARPADAPLVCLDCCPTDDEETSRPAPEV